MTLCCERQPTCYYATGPITSLRAQNCLQTQSSPGLCFISLCGKLKLEPKKGSWEALELKRSHFTSNSSPCCGLSLLFPFMSFSHSLSFLCSSLPLKKKNPSSPPKTPHLSAPPPPPPPSLGLCLILEEKSFGSVMAYGYLTSASPLIRLSSLNDATCGATNATEKSIKAFH